jgi:uncharacterized membrane protein
MTSTAVPVGNGVAGRVAAIDVIRGVVMVLMAIDHVRVYSGLPAGGPSAGIFFTRWITHFCAPAFVFLAGTSAYLYGRQHRGVSRFLLTRGLWLVFLELTVIRVAWTFNVDFHDYMLAGVIWMLGWCMVLMAGLTRLPVAVIGSLGIALVVGHNVMDGRFWQIASTLNEREWAGLWKVLYFSFFAGPITVGPGGPRLMVLYSIVPWIGVMAAGYAFGAVAVMDPARRRSVCLRLGLASVAMFVVLRGWNVYGDPRPWGVPGDDGPPMPALFDFLNTTKYPASLLFLLMTLGPTIALVPLVNHAQSAIARWLTVFGRVPFFFYLLHIPLIHLLAMGVSLLRLGTVSPWLFANHPMGNPPAPPGYTWSLGLLYLVWAIAIALLYVPCRWFAGVKARRRDWWLGYV